MPKPPPVAPRALKDCCRRTIEEHHQRIRDTYVSFPVIKDLPCPVCKEILEIRVYEPPGRERRGR
jgi:hypothetical protein